LLVATALLLLAMPAPAAPAPAAGGPMPPLQKYLLDDTDLLVVVNVKQAVASPLFAKHLRPHVEKWRDSDEGKKFFKALGFDPLKDVERVVVAHGKSCFAEKSDKGPPLILIQGRFNAADLRARLAKLDKEKSASPPIPHRLPGGLVQEVPGLPWGSSFLGVLDDHTILLAAHKAQAADALARASGRKTTRLAYPAMAAYLKRLKGDIAVQGFALESLTINTTTVSSTDANGRPVQKLEHQTLAQSGIQDLHLTVHVKDDIQARFVMTGAGPKFKQITAQARPMFDLAKTAIESQAMNDPKFAPIMKLIQGLSLRTGDGELVVELKTTAEVIKGLIDLGKKN
jgi:hypothetical protein